MLVKVVHMSGNGRQTRDFGSHRKSDKRWNVQLFQKRNGQYEITASFDAAFYTTHCGTKWQIFLLCMSGYFQNTSIKFVDN